MKKQIILFVIITFAAFATVADQQVVIGTNTFSFAFEDTTITTNLQIRIIEDWKVMITPWTNVVFRKYERIDPNDTDDYLLLFLDIFTPPVFDEKLDLWSFFVKKVDGENFIPIKKNVSDAYKHAFNFVDLNSEIFYSVSNLVNAVKNDKLRDLQSHEVTNLIYKSDISYNYNNKKNELLNQEYYFPSVLSFTNLVSGAFDYPECAYWTLIPVGSNDGTSFYATFPAVYRNGRWYLWGPPR